jgi:hypothetical protein
MMQRHISEHSNHHQHCFQDFSCCNCMGVSSYSVSYQFKIHILVEFDISYVVNVCMLVLMSFLSTSVHFLYRNGMLGRFGNFQDHRLAALKKNFCRVVYIHWWWIHDLLKYLEIQDIYIVGISIALVLCGSLTGKFVPLAGNFELTHVLQLLHKWSSVLNTVVLGNYLHPTHLPSSTALWHEMVMTGFSFVYYLSIPICCWDIVW